MICVGSYGNPEAALKGLLEQIRGEPPRARSTPWGHLGRLASEGGPSITLASRSWSPPTRDSTLSRFAEAAGSPADSSPSAAGVPAGLSSGWTRWGDPEKKRRIISCFSREEDTKPCFSAVETLKYYHADNKSPPFPHKKQVSPGRGGVPAFRSLIHNIIKKVSNPEVAERPDTICATRRRCLLYDHNSDCAIPYSDTKFLSWPSSRVTLCDALFIRRNFTRVTPTESI